MTKMVAVFAAVIRRAKTCARCHSERHDCDPFRPPGTSRPMTQKPTEKSFDAEALRRAATHAYKAADAFHAMADACRKYEQRLAERRKQREQS